MLVICRSFNYREAILLQKHVKSLTFFSARFRVEFEKLEQVSIFEIFLEVTHIRCCLLFRRLDYGQVDSFFVHLTPIYKLFNTAHSDKTVHNDVSLLSYSEYSIYGLVVVSWVPIGVHYHSSISSSEIESASSYFSGQQATEHVRVCIEIGAHLFTLRDFGISINSHPFHFFSFGVFAEISRFENAFHQVQIFLAHRKNQDSVTFFSQIGH
jgi:hypothetical protein